MCGYTESKKLYSWILINSIIFLPVTIYKCQISNIVELSLKIELKVYLLGQLSDFHANCLVSGNV